MFVGSRGSQIIDSAVPKNIHLSRHLIEVAESRSKNPKERDEIEYYKFLTDNLDIFSFALMPFEQAKLMNST
jgi:hypothetical protein